MNKVANTSLALSSKVHTYLKIAAASERRSISSLVEEMCVEALLNRETPDERLKRLSASINK
jgi:hypothetical protein